MDLNIECGESQISAEVVNDENEFKDNYRTGSVHKQ